MVHQSDATARRFHVITYDDQDLPSFSRTPYHDKTGQNCLQGLVNINSPGCGDRVKFVMLFLVTWTNQLVD